MRKNSYRNSKGKVDQVFASKDQSLDQFWVTNEERTICSQDLRELHYSLISILQLYPLYFQTNIYI